jgi:molybdopterin converting factor small subunit
MPTIKIPTPLRPYTEGNKEVVVEGQTVGAIIRDLTRQYPSLNQHLFDQDSSIMKIFAFSKVRRQRSKREIF